MRVLKRLTCIAVPALLAAAIGAAGPAAISAQKSAVPANPDDRTIVHVLNRLGFGAAPREVERVRQIGLQAYIDQQLHPERVADEQMAARLSRFETLDKSTRELAEAYFIPAQMARREQQRARAQDPSMAPPDAPRTAQRAPAQMAIRGERQVLAELTQQKILRAVYSERQLEEVMVDFWFNHFNVFAGKGQTRQYLTEYERDVIRVHALGRFRDLLQATAESPAMLFYLDNWQSAAPMDAQTAGRSPLFGPGNPRTGMRGRPGRVPPVAPGQPPAPQNRRTRGLNENYARELMELHTLGVDGGYTQQDVQEVARAFTGWTIANPRLGGGFRFEPRMHDDGAKTMLGRTIKAGGGKTDGEQVLDILAAHSSTARFISTKLARRFVSDDPPAALVDRAAERFRATGGDIREVVRTIVTSPEFFSAAAYRAKVKTPFEFVVSTLRATGAEAVNAQPLVQAVRELGMPLYMCQPPTGYADKAEAWVNTGALLNRMNFAVALTNGSLRGVRMRPAAPAGDLAAVRTSVEQSALAGDLSPSTSATVAKAATAPQVLALLLGSPEFQKR